MFLSNTLNYDFFSFGLKKLILYFKSTILSSFFNLSNTICIYIYYNKYNLFYILNILNKSSFFRYKSCTEFTVVDYLGKSYRYKIIYIFLSVALNNRLTLNFFYNNSLQNSLDLNLNSFNYLFSSLNWMEREVFDMFGFYFFNHSNLKPILLDYGFNYKPLLKTYPTSGFVEIYFSSILSECRFIPLNEVYK